MKKILPLALALIFLLSSSVFAQGGVNMKIIIGGKTFDAVLEDNAAARAFAEKLPLEISMTELNGNEKYFRFNEKFPSNDSRFATIHAGDLLLWSSNTVVLFYKTFSSGYSYTRLGKILNPAGLNAAAGNGNIRVRFEK